MKHETKVLLVGLGDLGSKIAIGLASSVAIHELVIAGRGVDAGFALERVASACGDGRVRFVQLDAMRVDEISEILHREAPSVVVQAASLLSPWFFQSRKDRIARLILQAGFAAQLCAQLPRGADASGRCFVSTREIAELSPLRNAFT
jgi:glutamyl-tRNA reductase